MAKSSENLMHIRVDYEGAKNSKKDLLMTEISVIKAVQILHAYKTLKAQEKEIRVKLQAKIKEARLSILSLQRLLPKIKTTPEEYMEEIFHIEMPESETEAKKIGLPPKPRIIKIHEDPLEAQLREIQEKLNQLG